MAALPYIQIYIADYLADTSHLTLEEHGAYLLLIFSYWQTGKPLPKARLARMLHLSNERWTVVERSLNEFFTDDGEYWIHERIEADLERVKATQEQRVSAGRASAAARQKASIGKASKGDPKPSASHSERSLNGRCNGRSTNKDTDTDIDKDLKDKTLKHLSAVADDVVSEQGEISLESPTKPLPTDAENAQTVFAHWVSVMGKAPNTRFTAERKRVVMARLKDGYTAGFIQQAIDGCASSAYHRGKNDRGTVYDDLELICRNATKLETFAGMVTQRGVVVGHDLAPGKRDYKRGVSDDGRLL